MIQQEANRCSTCSRSREADGGKDSGAEGDAMGRKRDRSKERRAEADCSLQHRATP